MVPLEAEVVARDRAPKSPWRARSATIFPSRASANPTRSDSANGCARLLAPRASVQRYRGHCERHRTLHRNSRRVRPRRHRW
jgi:hypothetical protein